MPPVTPAQTRDAHANGAGRGAPTCSAPRKGPAAHSQAASMPLLASASPAASESGACAGGGLMTPSTAAGRCRVYGEGDSSPGASRAE